MRTWLLSLALALSATHAAALPIFDAHLHYSHDAWDNLPPRIALELLRQLVSSANDEGQQRLAQLAPDAILLSLRPYRTRGDGGRWHAIPPSFRTSRSAWQSTSTSQRASSTSPAPMSIWRCQGG
jgi:hypothetical protein